MHVIIQYGSQRTKYISTVEPTFIPVEEALGRKVLSCWMYPVREERQMCGCWDGGGGTESTEAPLIVLYRLAPSPPPYHTHRERQ